MAGRCISVTHEALGTVRVMKTCGMMGEVVGKAASICVLNDCSPREVYEKYWSDLDELMQLPGKARRATLKDMVQVPKDAFPLAGPRGPIPGLDPAKLDGLVIDDQQAKRTGAWTTGDGLKGFVGYSYIYAPSDKGASIRFEFTARSTGKFDVRVGYLPHANRGSKAPVTIESTAGKQMVRLNQKVAAPLPNGFISVGQFDLKEGERVAVIIGTDGAGGTVHADAVQIVPVK